MTKNNSTEAAPPIDAELVRLRHAAKMASQGKAQCTVCKRVGSMSNMLTMMFKNLPMGALCLQCAQSNMLAGTCEGGNLYVRTISHDDILRPSLVAMRSMDAQKEEQPASAPDVKPFVIGEED